MKISLLLVSACAWCAWSVMWPTMAEADELVVLTVSAADNEDVLRLRELLDRPLRVLAIAEGSDPERAARAIAKQEVLVLDRMQGRVLLVRHHDREVLQRSTQGSLRKGSPYAVAFVAAELLAISAELSEQRARQFGWSRLAVALGPALRLGAPIQGVVRAQISLSADWARPHREWAWLTSAGVSFPGEKEVREAFGQVLWRRSDLELGLGASYRRRQLSLASALELGIGTTRVSYSGPSGAVRHALSETIGPSLLLVWSPWPWLGAYLRGKVARQFGRTEYRIQGDTVGRDAAWLGDFGAGLALFLPRS